MPGRVVARSDGAGAETQCAGCGRTHPVATLFVDSNVVHEFMTLMDLDRVVVAFALASPADRAKELAQLEKRRLNARGSHWLAMVLDHERRATLSLGAEIFPRTAAYAPADLENPTWPAIWVDVMAHYISESLCPGWQRLDLGHRRGGRAANDSLIIDTCRTHGFGVITRDGGVFRKAERGGIAALTPEEYAASSGLALATAHRTFFHRFDTQLPRWIAQLVADGAPETNARGWFEVIREHLEFVWSENAADSTIGRRLVTGSGLDGIHLYDGLDYRPRSSIPGGLKPP